MALTTARGQAQEKPVKLVFIRNTTYDGKEYGPSYQEKPKVVEVDAGWARQFQRSGRAVLEGDLQKGQYEAEVERQEGRRKKGREVQRMVVVEEGGKGGKK